MRWWIYPLFGPFIMPFFIWCCWKSVSVCFLSLIFLHRTLNRIATELRMSLELWRRHRLIIYRIGKATFCWCFVGLDFDWCYHIVFTVEMYSVVVGCRFGLVFTCVIISFTDELLRVLILDVVWYRLICDEFWFLYSFIYI